MSDLDELFATDKSPLCKVCGSQAALRHLNDVVVRMLKEKKRLPATKIAAYVSKQVGKRISADSVLAHLRNHESERWAQIEAL